MATYKYSKFVEQNNSDAFDKLQSPGEKPAFSGIYRCEACGHEVVAEHTRTLPPQNHHQHAPGQGNIRWRLIVYADHEHK